MTVSDAFSGPKSLTVLQPSSRHAMRAQSFRGAQAPLQTRSCTQQHEQAMRRARRKHTAAQRRQRGHRRPCIAAAATHSATTRCGRTAPPRKSMLHRARASPAQAAQPERTCSGWRMQTGEKSTSAAVHKAQTAGHADGLSGARVMQSRRRGGTCGLVCMPYGRQARTSTIGCTETACGAVQNLLAAAGAAS